MSADAFVMEYPERATYGELMKGYFSLMRGFGLEFAHRSRRVLAPLYGPRWFAEYLSQRRRHDVAFSPRQVEADPSFFLKEYVFEPESVYRDVLPDDVDLKVLARKIIHTRNTWFHFGEDPTPAQLREAAQLIRDFGARAQMAVAAPAHRMITRLDRIRTGQYAPAPAAPAHRDDHVPLPDARADDIARGFILGHFYDVHDGKIVHLDTGAALSDVVADEVAHHVESIESVLAAHHEPGGTVRVTDRGDVLYLTETMIRHLGTASPEAWFPGHLDATAPSGRE